MVRVPISFFHSFAERFSNGGLSFNCMGKPMTDLESARKIGLDTTLKFFEISKMFFMTFMTLLSVVDTRRGIRIS